MSQSETEQVETSRLDVQSGAQTPKMGNVNSHVRELLAMLAFPRMEQQNHIPSGSLLHSY